MIGIIGVGTMGGAIARCLIGQGMPLAVYDLDPSPLRDLDGIGAKVCASPVEVAHICETIIVSLPSEKASRNVAMGNDGVATGRAVKAYIETSTVSPQLSRHIGEHLNAHGIGMLEAPVSGTAAAAEAGKITSMLAGPASLVHSCDPIIRAYSSNVFHVGEHYGTALQSKIVNNCICILNIVTTFHCLSVAERLGITLPTLNEILNVSSGRNYTTTDLLPRSLLSAEPAFTGKIAIIIKDLQLFLDQSQMESANTAMRDQIESLIQVFSPYADHDVASAMKEIFSIKTI